MLPGKVARTRLDRFLRRLLCTAPTARRDIVCGNLTIQLSESVVRLVARACGVKDKLGVKGRFGVVAAKATRAALFGKPARRIILHFT
jgi:hypothetical protein